MLVLRRPKSARKDPRAMAECALPNGMTVFSHQKGETEFLFSEIWQESCYLKNGVVLEPGAVVFDVGANIGSHSSFPAALVLTNIPHIHTACAEASVD